MTDPEKIEKNLALAEHVKKGAFMGMHALLRRFRPVRLIAPALAVPAKSNRGPRHDISEEIQTSSEDILSWR